jgi:hypothetical protein
VLAGFGTALLMGAALEWLYRRRALRSAVLVAAIVLLVSRVPLLGGTGLDEMLGQTRPIYAEVARVARHEGAGPLLELPLVTEDGLRTEMEATLASSRHWLPLVNGHTGYPPPHRALVDHLIARLPASDALDDLVALTHVRWILLQPKEYWSAPQARADMLALPGVERALWFDGWDLLRVERNADHDRWFDAIAAGWRAGHTVLGTPIAALSPTAAKAALVASREIPSTLVQGRFTVLQLTVGNYGNADWPVALPPWLPDTYRVELRTRWLPVGQEHAPGEALSRTWPLPRDVGAGEQVRVEVPVVAPLETGTYRLVVTVEQRESESFAEPHDGRLEATVVVEPRT